MPLQFLPRRNRHHLRLPKQRNPRLPLRSKFRKPKRSQSFPRRSQPLHLQYPLRAKSSYRARKNPFSRLCLPRSHLSLPRRQRPSSRQLHLSKSRQLQRQRPQFSPRAPLPRQLSSRLQFLSSPPHKGNPRLQRLPGQPRSKAQQPAQPLLWHSRLCLPRARRLARQKRQPSHRRLPQHPHPRRNKLPRRQSQLQG